MDRRDRHSPLTALANTRQRLPPAQGLVGRRQLGRKVFRGDRMAACLEGKAVNVAARGFEVLKRQEGPAVAR